MTRRQILDRAETEAEKAGLREPKVYTCGDIYPKCFMTAIVNGSRKQVTASYLPTAILAIYTEKNRQAI